MSSEQREVSEYRTIQFEETELRLGLPNNHHHHHQTAVKTAKRGFAETKTNDFDGLKLNLSSTAMANGEEVRLKEKVNSKIAPASHDPAKPPSKAQVVGWPPVRSFRKNMVAVQKKTTEESVDQKAAATCSGAFVKVSMDGAPYLRKVDLKFYKSYQDMSNALAKMFSSFTLGDCGTRGMKDFMNESKLIDLLNGSDYVATYEDKDGDWMLVGDVPWEMFVGSCKRLRIMKGSEAIGLAPRAVEKCKNRS